MGQSGYCEKNREEHWRRQPYIQIKKQKLKLKNSIKAPAPNQSTGICSNISMPIRRKESHAMQNRLILTSFLTSIIIFLTKSSLKIESAKKSFLLLVVNMYYL